MDKEINIQIVKGVIAEYVLNNSIVHKISKEKLREILIEIANLLDK